MSRLISIGFRSLLSALFLSALCAFSVWYHILTYAYMAPALMGSFIIYVSGRPRRGELLGVCLASAAFSAAYRLATGEPLLSVYLPAFLGVGSLAVQGLTLTWGSRERRQHGGHALIVAAVFPAFLILSAVGLGIVAALNAKTYDHLLFAFDSTLGIAPSFAVGRFLANLNGLSQMCYYAYEFLPLAISVAFVLDRAKSPQWSPNLLSVFVSVALWGYVAYHLCPATGPVHVWPDRFPWHPPALSTVPLEKFPVMDAARNAMPSLHFGMALLIWLASRYCPLWWRIVSAALLVLNTIATLGFGEHYLIDLVVAVPFVVSALAWCTSALPLTMSVRSMPAIGGAVLAFAWLLLLRTGVPLFENRSLLAWISILMTIGLPLYWEARLAGRAASANPIHQPAWTGRSPMPPAFGPIGATE